MPFDTGLADDFDNGAWERSAEPFLPYVGHIGPGTVLLEGGGVMSMITLPGFPFELEDTAVRNTRRRQLNTLFRAIADDTCRTGTGWHVSTVPDAVVPPADTAASARPTAEENP